MTLITFLAKVIICSAIFFGYYFFFLRDKKFHQYNRYYLLVSAAFSFLFPLLQIPILPSGQTSHNVLFRTLKVITVSGWENEFVVIPSRDIEIFFLTLKNIAWAVYLSGFVILSVPMAKFFVYIHKLKQVYKREQLKTVNFYNTREPGTPFSFFNALFWNENILLTSENGQQILRHELVHIDGKHSYDLVFMKIVSILFWFNPVYYLFTKEIKAIHEFLADEYASSLINKHDYAELLVSEAISNKKAFLSNRFFHNQIKRRVAMLIKHHSYSFSYVRRIMAMPLLMVLFCAFSLKSSRHFIFGNNPAERLTVVIDAGHGGVDPGAQSSEGHNEKDLTLSIARKIKDLGKEYGIDIILTRDADILPGNASKLNDGLLNRTTISENNKADLFISIHINATGITSTSLPVSGFNIYVSGQNKQYNKSKLLASAISGEISKSYKIADVLKESNSIWVLKTSSMPAVLIQCGYMTDKKDLEFITNDKNQEKIARDILRGIVQYGKSVLTLSNVGNSRDSEKDTIPPLEFLNLLLQEDTASFTADHKTDLVVAKLKNGTTIKTRLSEVIKLKSLEDLKQSSENTLTFKQTEAEATFPGGSKEWIAYLSKNVKYPQQAQDKEIQGTVILQFIVDKEGNVSDIEALSGPDTGGLKEESIRMIKNSGRWIPGKQNGVAVTSYKKQPITYKLQIQ